MAVLAHLVQEHQLVREDVRRVAVIVVEVTQFGVQETRWPSGRDDPGGAHLRDVLTAAVHSALPFLGAEGFLGAGRHVVDHWVPDGARVLQHVHVDVPELFGQHVKIDGAGVIHVESRCGAVGYHEAGVADGSVGRSAQRDDHDVQVTLGAADPMLDGVLGLHEGVEPQPLQFAPQIRHRIVGQQYHRVLVDMVGQVLRVVVVLVQMRDVEVVAVPQPVPVQGAVVGVGKPRGEVRRVDPGVAEDAARRRLDKESGVADTGDSHDPQPIELRLREPKPRTGA